MWSCDHRFFVSMATAAVLNLNHTKNKNERKRTETQADLVSPKNTKKKSHKLTTWRGSGAEAACEVIFECTENSSHVNLHFIQTDDVFHQSCVNIHLS